METDDQSSVLHQNYFYLNHITSFAYDELIELKQIFENQASELNLLVSKNVENESKVG